MRPRPKGPQFPTEDIAAVLTAYGDLPPALPQTIQALDSIITDFIIELCHEAAARAHHAGRAKVKQDDFQWCLRRDSAKLGRVQDLLSTEKRLKKERRIFDGDEEGRAAAGRLEVESGEGGRGRGRKRKGRSSSGVVGEEEGDVEGEGEGGAENGVEGLAMDLGFDGEGHGEVDGELARREIGRDSI
jgi:transcription initiation factor TFIID subunit 13